MWVITKDILSEQDEDKRFDRTGVKSWDFREGANLPFKFRMKDDDGVVYFEGLCSRGDSFAPLDDLGMPDAGCTSIEYRRASGWEVL